MRILDTCIQKTREKPARLVHRLFPPVAAVIDRWLALYVYVLVETLIKCSSDMTNSSITSYFLFDEIRL